MASYKNGSITLENVYGKKTYETTIAECGSSTELQELTVTENGTYTAPEGTAYSPVNVNVPSKEEETKSITITENGTTTVLPTSGKVLSKVDIVANVPQTAESGTVKNLLDTTKSADYLFYKYKGTSVDNIISYSDTSSCTSMYNMFYGCENLTTIPQLDTTKCTDMTTMFHSCKNLTTIHQLDTSNVTKMNSMFANCENLTTIPQLDTSNVTSLGGLYSYCTHLTTIPQLDTSKCTSLINVFGSCYRLKTIDITHMNITKSNGLDNFSTQCYSLTKLIIRNMSAIPPLYHTSFRDCYHFDGTQNDTFNPQGLKDGRIYVPDDKVESLKTATNWSVFADIIVPLSTLVEE